ncbi:hypothetical protein CR513_20432, partial [Mucuna pruriens]
MFSPDITILSNLTKPKTKAIIKKTTALDNMANNDRTLKEWATPDIMYQPWCVQNLEWKQAQSYEHKSGLTHVNTQQFGIRESVASKVVNEVIATNNQRLQNKITELTSLVRQLAIGQHHSSPPVIMAMNNIQFQENVSATIQDLQTQISLLATVIPSQIILSPQENMSDITLRRGKELPQQQSIKGCSSATSIAIVQSLHALVIATNKLQVEQKEELLSYLELQTSKLDNLNSPGKLRQRSTTSLLQFNPVQPFLVSNMNVKLLPLHHSNWAFPCKFSPDYGALVGGIFGLLNLLSKLIFLDTFEH